MKTTKHKNNNVSENQKPVTAMMGNGKRVEIYLVDKDKNFYGKLLDEAGNITVFAPKSYLKSELPKPSSTRKRIVSFV